MYLELCRKPSFKKMIIVKSFKLYVSSLSLSLRNNILSYIYREFIKQTSDFYSPCLLKNLRSLSNFKQRGYCYPSVLFSH